MKVLWKDDAKELCKIGTSKTDAQFYKTTKVAQYFESINVNDEVEITFEKVKEGKYLNNYLTFIKKAEGGQKAAPTPTKSTGYKQFDEELSKRQTCSHAAGLMLQTQQGAVTADNVIGLFNMYFDAVYEKISTLNISGIEQQNNTPEAS